MEYYNKIKNIDLNLLKVFAFLDQTRSVSKSAKRLSISQPALSHALARLRRALGDRLFVKTPQEMVPTPYAQRVAPAVHRILGQIEQDLLQQEIFSPETLERNFRLQTTDFLEALLLPKLLLHLTNTAPNVQVSITSPKFRLPSDDLIQGRSDLAIAGFFGNLPNGFYQQKLFNDGFKSVVRQAHPRLGGRKRVSLSAYCREDHILIAPGGDLKAKIDELLATQKVRRSIIAGLSSFMVSGWVVNETDTILTAPTRLIDLITKKFDLSSFNPPVQGQPITIAQVWHDRIHQDPAHQWFRQIVAKCLKP